MGKNAKRSRRFWPRVPSVALPQEVVVWRELRTEGRMCLFFVQSPPLVKKSLDHPTKSNKEGGDDRDRVSWPAR